MANIGAVINSGSGPLSPDEAAARLAEIRRRLESRVSPEFLAIVPGDRVEPEIRRLVALKPDVLVVGGGDGTISTAAGILADADIVLAVLGLGTRNHFARDAGIPLEPLKAIELLDRMNEKRVDLGEVNGRAFINNASVGLYPKVVRKRRQTMVRRGWRKMPAFAAAAMTVLRRLPQMHVGIEIDGRRVDCRTPFLFVGNNEYQGAILADSKRTSLSGGRLWVCTARVSGVMELAGMAWQGWTNSVQNIDKLDTRTAGALVVHFRGRRTTVAIDGENCILDTPLRFTVRPAGLRVVAP